MSSQNVDSSETPPNKEPKITGSVKTSTLSIKDALNSLDKKKPSAENISEQANESPEFNDENDYVNENEESLKVSIEDIQLYWKKHVELLKSEEPRMYNVLRSQKPVFKEDHCLEVSFYNNAQVEEFKFKIKPPLLDFLRKSLKDNSLEIKEIIQDDEYQPNKKHYTDTDKLKHMIEKNPSLQKLRQEFNLDFE